MGHATYRYRTHLALGSRILPICSGGVAFLLLIGTFILVPPATSSLYLFSSLFALYIVIFGAVVTNLYGHLAGMTVSIAEDTVDYATLSGRWQINLDEIVRVRFPTITYVGGWITLVAPEKTIRISPALEDVSGFLFALKASLDAQGLSDRYDRKSFFRFLKTATLASQGWDRMARYLRRFVFVSLIGCVLSLVWVVSLGLDVPWVLALFGPMILFQACYMGAELELSLRFSKATDVALLYCPPPDHDAEDGVYRETTWFGGVLYVGGLVAAVFF